MTTDTTADVPAIITDPQTELDRFKRKVRRLAIRVARDESWCEEGLNDGLARLGLAPYVGPHRFVGTARVTGVVTPPPNQEDPPVLTTETALTYLSVYSSDSDVRSTGAQSRVTEVVGDGTGTVVTIEVEFYVINADWRGTAESWAKGSLRLDWTERRLLIDDRPVEITWTGEETDPDEPGAYDPEED